MTNRARTVPRERIDFIGRDSSRSRPWPTCYLHQWLASVQKNLSSWMCSTLNSFTAFTSHIIATSDKVLCAGCSVRVANGLNASHWVSRPEAFH